MGPCKHGNGLPENVMNIFFVFFSFIFSFWAYWLALVVKNPPGDAGDIRDTGSIPGLGRPPGEGNGNPLQCSCLGNPMDGGAWWATVRGVSRVRYDLVTKPQQQSFG